MALLALSTSPLGSGRLGIRYVRVGGGLVEVQFVNGSAGANIRHGSEASEAGAGANASLAARLGLGRRLQAAPPIVPPHYCHAYAPAHHGAGAHRMCYLDVPRACLHTPHDMAKYACAIVITKLTSSYVDTIIQSVRRLRTRTKAWIVVLAPNDTSVVPHSALAVLKQRMALADRKTIVYVHAWPVAPKNSGLLADKDLQPWFARLTEELPNCCAWREYFKLIAWKMNGFERVLLLDLDVHVLQSIDHLFSCPQALKALYAAGPSGPWQGGFFMVSPSLGVYHEMLNKLHNAQYSPQRFWFNSIDQLPRQFHTAKRCYGCEGPQGFLYWFFVLRKNRLQAYELDSCVYDAISPTPSCEPFWRQSGEAYRLKVIHKYSTKAVGVTKCRAQAANAARHVRGIVGAHDARTLFYVVQCQLGQDRRGGANKGREVPSGVSVEVLCQQYGHCR